MADGSADAGFQDDRGFQEGQRQSDPASVPREFIDLCRRLELFTQAVVAIDGSKFKAVNSKDRNDTRASMKRRIARAEQHIERYLSLLDQADRAAPAVRDTKVPDLAEKLASLKAEMRLLKKA